MATNSNDASNTLLDVHPWKGSFCEKVFHTLSECLLFIVENAIHTLSSDYTGNILNELFRIMPRITGNIKDDESVLQDFANIMAANLTIWVIDNGGKDNHPFPSSIQRENQQQYRSSIVLCKQNGTATFHPLYILDNNNKKHTILPENDPHIYKEYQLFMQAFVGLNVSPHIHEAEIDTDETESMNRGDQAAGFSETNDNADKNYVTWSSIAEENPCIMKSSSSLLTMSHETTTVNSKNDAINLPTPKLLNQPTRLWHPRYLKDGIKRPFTNIQAEGGQQREPLKIEFNKFPNEYLGKSYMGVRAVNHIHQIHEQNIVVPGGTTFQHTENKLKHYQNKRKCSDIFDEKTKHVYSEITPEESNNGMKKMSIGMVIHNGVITQEMFKEKKLKWSKLEYRLYLKTNEEEFKPVSAPAYTDLIQQTNDGKDAYENNNLIRKSLCENGGQIVAIMLDEAIDKNCLAVSLDQKNLIENEYQLAGKYLTFVSPPGEPGDTLLVTVYRKNGTLYESIKILSLPYESHANNDEPCDESRQ